MENRVYEEIKELSEQIVRVCSEKGVKIATAESCTGGMISSAVTSVSGSSAVIELGVCSYSNRIKREVLGVKAETLEKYSEYSIQCAKEMALGVERISDADFAVSTTGVAGPSGGSEKHPVGEVYIGIANGGYIMAQRFEFHGNRDEIRAQACFTALQLLLKEINKSDNPKF